MNNELLTQLARLAVENYDALDSMLTLIVDEYHFTVDLEGQDKQVTFSITFRYQQLNVTDENGNELAIIPLELLRAEA